MLTGSPSFKEELLLFLLQLLPFCLCLSGLVPKPKVSINRFSYKLYKISQTITFSSRKHFVREHSLKVISLQLNGNTDSWYSVSQLYSPELFPLQTSQKLTKVSETFAKLCFASRETFSYWKHRTKITYQRKMINCNIWPKLIRRSFV